MRVQKYYETEFLPELTYFYLGYLHLFEFALKFANIFNEKQYT